MKTPTHLSFGLQNPSLRGNANDCLIVNQKIDTSATASAYRYMKPNNKENKKHPGAVALGKLGGKAGRGSKKARPTDVARAAARARWNKQNEQGKKP